MATHVQQASLFKVAVHLSFDAVQLVHCCRLVPAMVAPLPQAPLLEAPPSPAAGPTTLLLHPTASATAVSGTRRPMKPHPDRMLGVTIVEELWTMAEERVSFSDQVKRVARALAFDAVGIARVGPDVKLERDVARWEAFTAAGMHGEMGWLAQHRGSRLRLDTDDVLEGARSVVCVARRYVASGSVPGLSSGLSFGGPAPNGSTERESRVGEGIAAYARGHDYHRFVRRRIRRLATFLRSLGTPEAPVHARPMVDEEPIFERAWAVRAGLGFIGKNGMLIVPGLGSTVLLAEVVTTLELEPDVPVGVPPDLGGEPVTERCGSCTRCLDACPTGAFAAPFVLDPRRCVAYLTIEHRSAIAPDLREGMGTHVFGCDDCQTVCPFNAGVGARAPARAGPDEAADPFAPLERWSRLRLEDLLSLDDAGWRALSEGTPLRRAGRAGLARNAAIALGNAGDARALPALRACASTHDDPVVRDAATWAVERIERGGRRDSPAG